MKPVKIYTKDFCPYCHRVKEFFEKKGVAFEEVDVTRDPDTFEKVKEETGSKTVPQVFIDGKFHGGCDDILALDAAGKLATLLQ